MLYFHHFSELFNLIFFTVLIVKPFLIAPVSSYAFFRPFVHCFSPDLDFHSFSVRPDNRSVQRLIMIGFRHGDIILKPSGNRLPQGMHHTQCFIASFFLVRIKYYAKGNKVINFVKIYMLLMHLFINTVNMFCPSFNFAFNGIFLQFSANNTLNFFCITIARFI